MPVIVNYEVYVFDKGEWTICSRYPSIQRDSAINEAKSLERQLNRPTKVIKESYDPKTAEGREVVIYLSEKLAKVKRKIDKKYGNSHTHAKSWLDEVEKNVINKKKPISKTRYESISYTSLIVRLFGLIFTCIILSAVVAFIVGLVLKTLNLHWTQTLMSSVIFASFIVFFVSSSVASALFFIPWHKIETYHKKPLKGLLSSKKKEKLIFDTTPASNILSFLKFAFTGKDTGNNGDLFLNEEPITLEQIKNFINEIPKEEIEINGINLTIEKDEILKEEYQYTKQKEENNFKSAKPEDPKIIEIKVLISSFIDSLLITARSHNIKIDIYTRIGINLISAGACERIISFFALPADVGKNILKYAIAYVAKVSLVSYSVKDKDFYNAFNVPKFEGYHQKLIVVGNKSMDAILRKSKKDVYENVGKALMDWRAEIENKISIQEEDTELKNITLMFTDIVNYTEMTTQKGEEFVQKILRANNAITREALRLHQGREIKNMGDGFFIAFSSPLDGALTAIDIQEKIRIYNDKHPKETFFVRIGLNSGEVMEEDGDLFGSAVNTASRISSEAGAEEIFVSENIYQQIKSEDIAFADRGYFSLRGLDEKQHIYSISKNNPPEIGEREKNEQEELSGGASINEEEKMLEDDFQKLKS